MYKKKIKNTQKGEDMPVNGIRLLQFTTFQVWSRKNEVLNVKENQQVWNKKCEVKIWIIDFEKLGIHIVSSRATTILDRQIEI